MSLQAYIQFVSGLYISYVEGRIICCPIFTGMILHVYT